jgi:hypothetical protein
MRGGNVGNSSSLEVIKVKTSPEGSNPAAAVSRDRRRCSDRSSSTPPAPPPTTPILARPLAFSTRVRAASKRSMKPSIGFTGMACSVTPGICRALGVEPMLIDRMS